MSLLKKVAVVGLSFGLACSVAIPSTIGHAATVNSFQVSSGVSYKENKEVINSKNQSIRVMEVNMADPYTKIDMTVPNPLNKVLRTSVQAKNNHREGNRVVGGINGSFFEMSTTGLPMYLVSKENKIYYTGFIANGSGAYVNKPIAFGIDRSGNPVIDYYNMDLKFSFQNSTYQISGINKVRNENELIIYTPEYQKGSTGTNDKGEEVVLTNVSKNTNLAFGDVITGTVSKVDMSNNNQVPADGLVLSAHGSSREISAKMKVGEPVTISLNMDDKWKNTSLMLTSGPLLVNNGKVDMTIDPNSFNAKQRAARSAIAIDKTGKKVFMVTVDEGSTGYSSGMNLTEFANYLVSLGAYKALNLDGGGSTTMVARKQGGIYASVMNNPSGGVERAVSTTLQAISTAPAGIPNEAMIALSHTGDVLKDTTVTVKVSDVLDHHYTPLNVDTSKIIVTTTLGKVNKDKVVLDTPGKAVITAKYGNVTNTFTVNVVDEIPTFSDVGVTSPYYQAVQSLSKREIIAGYTDGTYRPGKTLSRLDASLLLVRSLKLDTTNVKDISFVDVPKTYRYYNEIAAIVNAGIMKGKGGNKFDLNAPLTRAEMAVVLTNAFKLTGTGEKTFKDVPPASFAYSAVSYLVENNVTTGYTDGTYRPGEAVTRGQYALFLYRIMKD